MTPVMGAINGVRLLDIMSAASSKCSRVSAAVAYATNNGDFFKTCLSNKIYVDYFGLLDEDEAVSVAVLQMLLEAGPLAANCRLIKGHFHSKIIWWHGYGAYIGSANLTHAAWFKNVECGIFFPEDEIIGSPLQSHLELQFEYLKKISAPLTTELVKALRAMRPGHEEVTRAKRKLTSQFEAATKDIPTHGGLDTGGPSIVTTGFTRFTAEWNETLELLRGLCRDFQKLGLQPDWVSVDANPTVHFDQFLHAFYYVRIRDEQRDDDTLKSVELVNRAFERNRKNPKIALREAAEWWASLDKAPYGEDKFIREVAPMMRNAFEKEKLASWNLHEFKKVFFEVHAFKTHARQIKNKYFNLEPGYSESAKERSDRLAEWLWNQPREDSQMHVTDLLKFLVFGSSPSNMVERLWQVTHDEKWRYDHLGPSSLGEVVGWARPDDYPPRNNRTNKALRSLGHDVRLFSGLLPGTANLARPTHHVFMSAFPSTP